VHPVSSVHSVYAGSRFGRFARGSGDANAERKDGWMKGQQKPKQLQKKAAQKTLKEKRAEKKAKKKSGGSSF
jgi:hypothetical protein